MPTLQITTVAGVPTQISKHGIGYRQLQVQNNAAASIRFGDSTVSATTGLAISQGGSDNLGPFATQGGVLSDRYVYCASAQLVDIDYVPA
jgi:hypothetical protein